MIKMMKNNQIECPRCKTLVEKYVACELKCPACGGIIDCSDYL